MNLEELYLKRQSTREFSDKPVTEEVLERICRLAALAPSAINAQPWRLYAVAGQKAKEFIPLVQKNGANGWAECTNAFVVIEALAPHAVMRGERRVSNEEFISRGLGELYNRSARRTRNCRVFGTARGDEISACGGFGVSRRGLSCPRKTPPRLR